MLRCLCMSCYVTHGVGVGVGWGNNVHVTLAYVRAATSPMGCISNKRVTMDMACKCLTLLTHTWDCPNRVGPLPS